MGTRSEWRRLRADALDCGRAFLEGLFYRRIIFDPPPWPGWPDRFRLWKKAKR